MSTVSHHAQDAWATLTELYGARWLRDRGKLPTQSWVQTLDGCKSEVLGKVMQAVKQQHPTHPVTLTDFQRLVKAASIHVTDISRLRLWWYSVATVAVERTGALHMPDGQGLWTYGKRLHPRFDGDTTVLQGSLGVEARNLAVSMADKYSQLELGGGVRSTLDVPMQQEILIELIRIAGEVYR